jgi:hypothetical protein
LAFLWGGLFQNQLLLEEIDNLRRKERDLQQVNEELRQKALELQQVNEEQRQKALELEQEHVVIHP